MKELVYDVAKRSLHYRDGDNFRRLGTGYSGYPPHTNDVASEGIRSRGPIPRGTYRILRPFDHTRLGPVVFFLDPHSSNQMFGRSGFFIHGDNEFANGTASHGCIVLKRAIRDEIATIVVGDKCNTLIVT